MTNDIVCESLCENITELLLSQHPARPGAAYHAAQATLAVSDALHHASGAPYDARWSDAVASLDRFLSLCQAAPSPRASAAMRGLRGFVDENADLLDGASRTRLKTHYAA